MRISDWSSDVCSSDLVPFYFFHAGTLVSRDALSWEALGLGLVITAVVLPLRIGMVWLQRRVLFRGERRKSTLRVSVALAPTLVFTLVLAEILHSRFGISGALSGALILYTTLNTLLPSLVLRMPFDVDPIVEGYVHPEDKDKAERQAAAAVDEARPAAPDDGASRGA